MAELGVSSFVLTDLDPDTGDPSGLRVGSTGDVIVSSFLSTDVRRAITTVEDSSSTWDAGGDAAVPADLSGKWEGTYNWAKGGSGTLGDTSAWVNGTSGNVATVSGNLATVIDSLSPVSATIATNTASIEDNTQNIATVGAVSANIATNTTNIATNTASGGDLNDWVADLGSASAGWDGTEATVGGASAMWASSIASSVAMYVGSAVVVSGFGNGDAVPVAGSRPAQGARLVVDTQAQRLRWLKGPFSQNEIGDENGVWEAADTGMSFNLGDSDFSGANLTIVTRELSIGNSLSSHPDATTQLDGVVNMAKTLGVSGDITLSGDLSGLGNIGVVGQIVCGQNAPGTADLYVRDDNSDATIEIDSGANYDSLIKFRENNAWRSDMGWDGGDNDFILKTYTGDINLDPYAGFTVSASCSSITVSSCPVPPPWSFVEVTADDGENTADPYYFASGSTQSKTEIDDAILWNSTNSYFTIANAGYYEFEMQGSITVGSSPTTVTTSIIQTAGLGGSETEKIDKVQVLRTNIDPHDIVIKWMGYVGAGTNFTCKLDGTATVRMEKGSTFTCKRIN